MRYQGLIEKYRNSDVAVHVESFDLKNRLTTRLSFSTKIIDCMNSGCAILAIGPNSQAGMAYLKDNNAAICINNIKDIVFDFLEGEASKNLQTVNKAYEFLNLDENEEVVLFTPLGYPNAEPRDTPRKELDEFVVYMD